MGFKEFLERLRAKRAKYKEYDEDMRVQELYEQRRLSANERELNKYLDKEREETIKQKLEFYRAREKDEIEFGHQILNTKNMFKNSKTVLLKNSNMFGGKSNINTKGGLFWK